MSLFVIRWCGSMSQYGVYFVCCAERDSVPFCTAHNTHVIIGHAATPPHNKLRRKRTECFNINITLARLNCKLPDDGCIPKHVRAI